MTSIRKTYKDIKTLLHLHTIVDFFNLSKYGFSPYRACEHGCVYCDGRAEKYYVEGEFDKDIVIRRNAPEILEKELTKAREKGFVCIGSGVSDPYQPVEKEEKILRRCAEVLLRQSRPVVIMTKSSLALRDLDLWKEVHQKSGCFLMMSCTFADDSLRARFEPGSSPISERIETLRKFKEAGCFTGVLAVPFLPLISETEDNMIAVAKLCKQASVDCMMPGGLTLRPGVQKETFFQCVKEWFPTFFEQYERIYCENRQSGAPSRAWYSKNAALYTKMIDSSGVPCVIPRYIYQGRVSLFDELYLILTHMKFVYDAKGIATARLNNAIKCYVAWVHSVKAPINRSRKRAYEEIDLLICQKCNDHSLNDLFHNEKLSEYVRKVIDETRGRSMGKKQPEVH